MSFTLGSSNGEPYASVGFRRHTFAFEGGNVTAQSIRGNDVKSVFVGSVKANTTYVMEVEAGENETTLYLYEKGKTRAEGIIHTAAADNWNKFRLQGHSYCADGLIENIMYVDNVKLQSPQGQSNRFVYDALGRVRFSIDAENYVTEQKYNANGQVVESVRYTDKLPSNTALTDLAIRKALYPAAVSQDFSAGQIGVQFNGNIGNSLRVEGGRLVSQNRSLKNVQTWPEIASTAVDYKAGALLTADVTTTELAGMSFTLGSSNGEPYASVGFRRHTFAFEGGNVTAQSIRGNDVKSVFVGSVKANTTYVMEVEAGENETTLYLYEKGKTRAEGIIHTAAADNWNKFRLQGHSYCADGLIENIMYVDNVKLQSPQGQSNRFVYDALGRVRFSIDAENYVTEQKYNANGQVVESVRYTDKLPSNTALTDLAIRKALYPAAVSQDFSAGQIGVQFNGNIGNSLRVEGGRLVSQNRSLKNVQTWPEIASTAVDYKAGALLTADVTTTELAGMSFTLGSSNGEPYASVGFRRHTFAFEGGNVTAQSIRGNDVKSVFVGSVKANTTYVMEVEAGENETTLYLYEKGKTRAEGIIHTAAAGQLENNSVCKDIATAQMA